MESLKHKCYKTLGISETIYVEEILEFANKNDDKDIRCFPLVNFKDERVHSMNDMMNGFPLVVLFYKKMKGYFGPYYILYCKSIIDNDFVITRSNKKLNSHMDYMSRFEEEIDDNLFINSQKISFTPISDECIKHLGIFYKDIVINYNDFIRF